MFDVIYKPEDFAIFREAKANVEKATELRIATDMIKLGKYPVEEISLLTKLPLETIEQLAKGLGKPE